MVYDQCQVRSFYPYSIWQKYIMYVKFVPVWTFGWMIRMPQEIIWKKSFELSLEWTKKITWMGCGWIMFPGNWTSMTTTKKNRWLLWDATSFPLRKRSRHSPYLRPSSTTRSKEKLRILFHRNSRDKICHISIIWETLRHEH